MTNKNQACVKKYNVEEIAEKLMLFESCWWAGTDYTVGGMKDDKLGSFADNLITKFNREFIKFLREEKKQ